MTMQYDWETSYCEYLYEDPNQPAGKVRATFLTYEVWAYDDAVQGVESVRSKGKVDVSTQKRVYTLAALQNVPNHVLTGWVQDALGQKNVDQIEGDLLQRWNDAVTPPGGGFETT